MSEFFNHIQKRIHLYNWRIRVMLFIFLAVLLAHLAVICLSRQMHIFVVVSIVIQAAAIITFIACENFERISHAETRKKRSLLARASRIEEIQGRRLNQHQSIVKILADRTIASGNKESSFRILIETASSVLKSPHVAYWRFERDALDCVMLYEAEKGISIKPALRSTHGGHNLQQYFEGLRVAVLSRESEMPLSLLLPASAVAALATPVYHKGRLEGIVVCSVNAARRWKLDEQDFLASLGDVTALINEIAARREAENELKIKSLAIDEAMEGVLFVNVDDKIIFANRAAKELTLNPGIEPLIGRKFRTLFSHASLQELEKKLLHVISIELNATGEAELKTSSRPEGVIPVALSLSRLAAGGMIVVIRDITDLKKAEKEARESARFLRQVIDTDPNLIFVKDKNSCFTLVNKAMLDVFNMSMSEILGKSDFDLNMPRHQAEAFQRADKEVFDTKRDVIFRDEKLTDKSGRLLRYQTVKRPLLDSLGRVSHVLGVACDITERKELEERLTQKQKLEAVGQLAGGIAHDFNNLLTGVLGYSKLIRDSVRNAELESHADNISRIAQKASDLTEQLLAFARKGKNKNIPVDINKVVNDTLTIISRTISPDIIVKTQLLDEVVLVSGDPTQLQQVVLNLCINSRDAMTRELSGVQGGTIDVATKIRRREEVALSHSIAANRECLEYVEISVSDTGCGMTDEVLSKCFEPFYTTKSDGPGAGMGLAMVYGIVESHGGFISVESSPFFGTTFRVYIPRSNALALPERVEFCQIAPVRGNGTILLVDDHQEIRDVTSQMLKTLGYVVETACDGVEAMSLVLSGKAYQLIVLDVIMPRMSGKECFREIRRVRPDCPIVFSTGYLGNHALGEELMAPGTAFVQKPYRLEQLSQIVAMLLSKAPPGSNNGASAELLLH